MDRSAEPVTVYVNVLPASGSAVVMVATTVPEGRFSATVVLLSAMPVGTSLTFETVIVHGTWMLRPPLSVACTSSAIVGVVSKSMFAATFNCPLVSVKKLPGFEASEYVNVAPASGSPVACAVPTTVPVAEFSAIALEEKLIDVGGSLTSVIEIVNVLDTERPPRSLHVTDTGYDEVASKLNTIDERSCNPARLKLVDVMVQVNVSPTSGSPRTVNVPTGEFDCKFSAMEDAESEMPVGGSLTFVTVMRNVRDTARLPLSFAVMPMSTNGCVSKSSGRLSTRSPFARSVNALVVSPVIVYVNDSLASTSTARKVPIFVLAAEFSAIVLADRRIFWGASFTSTTLIVNPVVAERPPASVTVTDIRNERVVS
eukprot:Opistho-1_new@57083